jgi:hypothetical protein
MIEDILKAIKDYCHRRCSISDPVADCTVTDCQLFPYRKGTPQDGDSSLIEFIKDEGDISKHDRLLAEGLKTCPHCKSEVFVDDIFCPICKTVLHV